MKYKDLENLKLENKLILTKESMGLRTRRKYINSKTKGETINGIFIPDIERVEIIEYQKFFYGARLIGSNPNSWFKITKKEYYKLLKMS